MKNKLFNIIIYFIFTTFFTFYNTFLYGCISKDYNDAYSCLKQERFDESFKRFNVLYNDKCPNSPYFLGYFYSNGLGSVEKNNKIAKKYFIEFLENNCGSRDYKSSAYFELYRIYLDENDIEKANYNLKKFYEMMSDQ